MSREINKHVARAIVELAVGLKKGSPVVGDPGVYVVPMGRAISTSGETSIKIIVRPGTNQVITAYSVK